MNESIQIHEHRIADEQHCVVKPFKRVYWTAILVGALVGIGLSFLLNLFGFAIGLSMIHSGQDGDTIVAGGALSLIVIAIVSMGTAGYASGYLGKRHCGTCNLGLLYGFTTWSVALILSAFLTTALSRYVSTYTQMISGTTMMPQYTVSAIQPESKTQNTSNSESKTTTVTESKSQTDATQVVSLSSITHGVMMLFILFFIGALSSCLGAYWAMACSRKDD